MNIEKKRCALCGGLALTLYEAWHYHGPRSVSIFCEISRKRICVKCAGKIDMLLHPPSTTRVYRKSNIPQKLRWEVFKRDGYKCRKCGSTSNLQCDHIYPEFHGGKTVIENLQTLCATCNKAKRDKVEI